MTALIAPLPQWSIGTEHPVERPLAGQILSLIQQHGDHMGRGAIDKSGAAHLIENALALLGRECPRMRAPSTG